MRLSHYTPLVLAKPDWYIDPDALPDGFDIEQWSEDFVWEQDEWNGLRDSLSPVSTTLDTQTGDCEDYAFVAASALVKEGKSVDIVFMCTTTLPLRAHVVAVGPEHVYSSGSIRRMTLRQFMRTTPFSFKFHRGLQ